MSPAGPDTLKSLDNPPVLEILESGIALISLAGPEEKVIILSEERLDALRQLIRQLKDEPPIGLIITGNSEKMFSAGADINVIQSIQDEATGTALARKGQEIFDEIDSLPFIAVAAISGPCVGGACELALACDLRIISDSRSSKIGLPEVKIGILPGFGGTQRLPRLIGLKEAIKLISGKRNVITPKEAYKLGLVDEITGYNNLIPTAEAFILEAKSHSSKVGLIDTLMTKFGPVRNFAVKKAGEEISKKAKHYPAPIAALKAIAYGLENGMQKGLGNEAKELGRLIATPECKALTNLFFLTESSKSIGKPAREHIKDLNSIVIGAGTMGAGIAGALATIGADVTLKDTSEEALSRGLGHIKKDLSYKRSLLEAERTAIINGIEKAIDYPEDTSQVNFLIEAIFENLDLKKKVLGEAASKLNTDAIIASNTSSLSVSEIASEISNPERVVGMHFFNPVSRMPLVEIIRAKETSDQTICFVAALAAKLGKFPIVVEDVPGFLINRILSPYLNEAAFLMEEGYQIEDIDRAAKNFGMPMGPIRLLDEIGLDVAAHVAATMRKGYGKRMEAPLFCDQLVEAKRLGKKNKLGFYNHFSEKESPDQEVYSMLGINTQKPNNPEQIEERLILSLVNEAVLCLDEGVAGQPGKQAAEQIDLGTVMGIGFPAFRGGLIYYANSLTATKLVNTMQSLERNVSSRFRPVSGILSRAEKGVGFYE